MKKIKSVHVFGFIALMAQIFILLLFVYDQRVTNSPLYPQNDIVANPYVFCPTKGEPLRYSVNVDYTKASKERPVVAVFRKNLLKKVGDRFVPVSTVANGINHVIRVEPASLTIPVTVDIKNDIDAQNFIWESGEYIFRDSVVNEGYGRGSSSYDVRFFVKCEGRTPN